MTQSSANLCQFLEWDSNFFGYRIARVIGETLTEAQADKIDQWCVENKIDCLYFLAVSDDAQTTQIAEDHDYRFVDVRHLYQIDLTKPYPTSDLIEGFSLDIATPDDIQDMLPMIANAFVHTRFYYDPYFGEEKASRLYQTWLIRSIEENFADCVIVIRKQGIPQAFITCSLDQENEVGSIGLVGVAESARGQNLGSTVVLESFAYFQQENMKQAHVVTQGRNIAANRLYQKCGFRISEVHLWYHKWF